MFPGDVSKASWRFIEGTHHFETKTSINHQEHQINDLAEIDHTVEVVATLDECDSPGLSRYHRDRSLRLVQVVFGESFDQRPEQS